METWIGYYCPKCTAHNLVYGSDSDDSTGSEPDGGICWKCNHYYLFEYYEGKEQNAGYGQGRELK